MLSSGINGTCENGWFQFYNKCIFFGTTYHNFDQALQLCHDKGSYLVEIDSASKQLLIENSIPVSNNLYWIGLKDIVGNNSLSDHFWIHSNRSWKEVGYQNLSPFNLSHSLLRCIALYSISPFYWYDKYCDSYYLPICEKG